jgi:hypothetical protein
LPFRGAAPRNAIPHARRARSIRRWWWQFSGGDRLFHLAAIYHASWLVPTLVAHGVDPTIKNGSGWTPLKLAGSNHFVAALAAHAKGAFEDAGSALCRTANPGDALCLTSPPPRLPLTSPTTTTTTPHPPTHPFSVLVEDISAGAKVGTRATRIALQLGVACCEAGRSGLLTWLLEQNTVALGDAAASCLALRERTETARMELQEAYRREAVAMTGVSSARSHLAALRVCEAAAAAMLSPPVEHKNNKIAPRPCAPPQRSPAHEVAHAAASAAQLELASAEAEVAGIRSTEAQLGRQLKSVGAVAALLEVYAAGHAVAGAASTVSVGRKRRAGSIRVRVRVATET